MRLTRSLLTLLLVATCLVACTQERESYIVENHPNKNFEKFYTVVRDWPYALEPNRMQAILNNYPNLKVGARLEEIKALLGEPEVVDVVYQSDSPEKKITSWLYVLKMSAPLNEGGTISSAIVVYFDESGQLIAAKTNGIMPATSIGNLSADRAGRYSSYW